MHILEDSSVQLDGLLANHAEGHHVSSDVRRPTELALRLCVRRGAGCVHGRRLVGGEIGRVRAHVLLCIFVRVLAFGLALVLSRLVLSDPLERVHAGMTARVFLTPRGALSVKTKEH